MGFLFNYNKGAYQAINSAGLDKISNDSLRNVLVDTYEFQLPRAEIFFKSDWYTFDKTNKLKLHQALIKANQVKSINGKLKIFSKPNEDFLKQTELLERIKIEQDILSSTKGDLNNLKFIVDRCLKEVNKELDKQFTN